MPWINTPKKKEKSNFHNDTPMRELRQKAYQNKNWKTLRESHLKRHPLCEVCLEKGVVTPAGQVHHKVSPFSRGRIDWELFLDDNNLESICPTCHALKHQEERGYKSPEQTIKELDELLGYKPTAADFIEVLEEFFDED